MTALQSRHLRNTLDPGTMLRQYRIDKVIGQGGFGITYLAVDTDLHRKVAIKECYPRDFVSRDGTTVIPTSSDDAVDFEWALKKFVDEATTLARFRHNGIVQVLQIIKDENNSAYMILEFVEGQSLDQWLKSLGRRPTEDELLGIVHPLIEALKVVHANDIAHRDIAPDNIYIKPDGHAVLLDFGAAKATVGQHSRTLNLVVKDGYSAPEQYYNEGRQGPWTDIYALSATLYRALTGKRPVDSMARIDAANNGEPDPLIPATKLELEGYSSRFLAALDRGLVPQMKDRPKTIEDWATEFPPLRPAPTPNSSVAPTQIFRSPEQPSRAQSATGSSRSKTALLAAACATVLLVAGGGYFYWAQQQQSGRQEAAWNEAERQDTRHGYQAFLTQFPDSPYGKDAERALEALDGPWQKSFAAAGPGRALAVATDEDSVFLGGIEQGAAGVPQIVIRRMSHSGKLIWEKRGSVDGRLNALMTTGDGGILAIGLSGQGRETDGLALSYDAAGTLRWQKTFGGPGADRFNAAAATPGGDAVLVGFTPSRGTGGTDGWIVRVNAKGETVAEDRIGGPGDDAINAVALSPKGEFLLGGRSSAARGEKPNFWIVRRSLDGAVIFDRTPGGGDVDAINALATGADGATVLVGDTRSFGTGTSDGMILRLTGENQMVPNVVAEAGEDHIEGVAILADGSIVVGGGTSSKSSRGMDAWIIRYNPTLSTRLWERVIGGRGRDIVHGLSAAPDGAIYFAGETENMESGKVESWIGKLTANGNGAE